MQKLVICENCKKYFDCEKRHQAVRDEKWFNICSGYVKEKKRK